jgi:putative membrane protein
VKVDIWVLIKGALMGAADIVPGVSGGTIAFITGIYERLLSALNSILPAFLHAIKHRTLQGVWQKTDAAFLITLFAGIVVSAISLAKLITFLLENYPIPLWSAFFGLILASVYIIGREIDRWNLTLILALLFGALFAWGLTSMAPSSIEQTLFNAFLSGVLAICAMVLPGISGSFILLILGTYAYILGAVKDFDFSVLSVFVLGCAIGILSIAKLLVWAFSKYRSLTLAVLTGFMLGALNKVWPWKEVLSYRENRHGELVPLLESNILPSAYTELTQEPAQVVLAITCAFISSVLVVFISKIGVNKEKGRTQNV